MTINNAGDRGASNIGVLRALNAVVNSGLAVHESAVCRPGVSHDPAARIVTKTADAAGSNEHVDEPRRQASASKKSELDLYTCPSVSQSTKGQNIRVVTEQVRVGILADHDVVHQGLAALLSAAGMRAVRWQPAAAATTSIASWTAAPQWS